MIVTKQQIISSKGGLEEVEQRGREVVEHWTKYYYISIRAEVLNHPSVLIR